MSNDLIFSILPRNTKVPIETDNRVKKVARSEKSEALNQDEKEQHDEVHIVDEMEQRERHEKNNEKNEHSGEQESLQQKDSQTNKHEDKEDDKSIGQQLDERESRELNTSDATGTKIPRGIKHVDITI